MKNIVRGYVSAISDYVSRSSKNERDLILQDMQILFTQLNLEICKSALSNSSFSRHKKLQLFDNICSAIQNRLNRQLSKHIHAIFYTLIKRGHFSFLNEVYIALKDKINGSIAGLTVRIFTAKELDAARKDKLMAIIHAKLKLQGNDSIKAEFCTDKSMISGLMIDIGSKRLDLSLSTKLKNLCVNFSNTAINIKVRENVV